MGVVNLGVDTLIKREVAIKSVLRPQGESPQTWQETVQRLVREAQAAGSLRHPNIVAIYDIVADEESPSIIMEFVRGKNVSELTPLGTPIPIPTAVQILKECADALDHAHAHGIVHRDIKPSNIMLDESGSVRLTDFGIAKVLGSNTDLTHGMAVGTLEYMSPEQIEAQAITGRTDQYSLGVVAYRMLTGHKIFDAETIGSWCSMILNREPVPASGRNPQLPKAVDSVLSRAMGKRPESRYDSCGAFVGELGKALQAKAAAGLTKPASDSTASVRKGFPAWAAVVVGSAVAAAVIAYLAIHFSAGTVTQNAGQHTVTQTNESTAATHAAKSRPPDSPAALSNWKNPVDGEDYEYLAPATFTMGCVPGDKSCDEDEAPHPARIEQGFWMGKKEVSVQAYQAFAAATKSSMPPAPDFNPNWSLQTHPIVEVTWAEAKSFCEWAGGRLATETEWEYAARGGKPGQKYISGNGISPADANYNGKDGFEYTAPVGSFAPNGFGLFDMSGNAAEWVDGKEGNKRVIRGGSWNVYPESLRLSKRVLADGDRRNFTFGLRCAM